MRAFQSHAPASLETSPPRLEDVPDPEPGPGQLLIRVSACALCHTDLHVIEGDLPRRKNPIIPGHQAVGVVERTGPGVTRYREGDRVGAAWVHSTCGVCEYCGRGDENLCTDATFTGYDVDGGFAETMLASQEYVFPLPRGFPDETAAPLLCSGIIGFRALRLCGISRGGTLGLYGFGASAHLALQVARHWGCTLFVFSRSEEHRRFARELGAEWTGTSGERPPEPMDGAVVFAPAGEIVPKALAGVKKGGTVALAGITMSPVPQMPYAALYDERMLRSVANFTRSDAREFLMLAGEIPVRPEVRVFPFEDAPEALRLLKSGGIRGAAVLKIS